MTAPSEEDIQGQAIASEVGTAVKHSFVYGIGGALAKAIGFLLLPLYTHYLTPKDYGILELLDLSMSLLAMFVGMGLSGAFLKFYGAAETLGDKKRIVSTYLWFTLSSGVLISIIGLVFLPAANRLLLGPGVPLKYLLLSFSSFVLGYVGTVPYTYIRAKEQSTRIVVLDTLGLVLTLMLNVYFIVFLKAGILGLLVSPIICSVGKLVFLFAWMWHDVRLRLDWTRLVQLLSFGGPLVLSNLTMFTLNFSDRLFLQHFQSLDVVGIYSVGYKFAFMLNYLVIQQFNMMWQARLYIIQRLSDHRRIFGQVFTLYSLLLIASALALSLFSPEILLLMVDPRFRGGAEVIPVVSLAYIFLGIGYYLQLGMFLVARTSLIGLASAFAAAVNLIMNYFLIRSLGMMGAAWATLGGFGALAIGSYYLSERVYPLALGMGRVTKALGLAVGLYLLSRVIPMPNMAIGSAIKIVLLGGFGCAVWWGRILSMDELATLQTLSGGALKWTSRLRNAT